MDPDAATKQNTPGSLDWARTEIVRLLGGNDGDPPYVWVRELFVDRAIVEFEGPEMGTLLYEYPWTFAADGETVLLGEPTEITLAYVPKSDDRPGELTGPIVAKNVARQIAYAAVLVPGEPDVDGDTLTADKVEQVAHDWLARYRNLDLQHTLDNVDAVPVESYLSPVERTVEIAGRSVRLPAGTWILASKVRDDVLWDRVVKGELTGYSVMGVRAAALKGACAAIKRDGNLTGAAVKRTTLADLGPDWVAPFVSFVDEPAVPKAKWFALKAATPVPDPGTKPGLLARIFGRGDSAAKEGRKFSDATYSQLQAAAEVIAALLGEAEAERERKSAGKAHDQKTPEEVTEMNTEELTALVGAAVKSAVDEATAPISEKLETLEADVTALKDGGAGDSTASSGDDGNPSGAGDPSPDGEPDPAALEALDQAIKAAVDQALAPIAEKLDELDGRVPTGSKAIGGQDGAGDPDGATKSKPFSHRDAYGRRIRT